jgi:hypothetical protein
VRLSMTAAIVFLRCFFVRLIDFRPWDYSLRGLCP